MTTSNKYSLENLDKRFFFNQKLIEQSFLNQNLDISLTHIDDFEFTVEVFAYGDCFAAILDKIYAIAIESFWSKKQFKIRPIQTQSEIPFFMNEPIYIDIFLIHSSKTKAVLEVFVYQRETDIFNETVEIILNINEMKKFKYLIINILLMLSLHESYAQLQDWRKYVTEEKMNWPAYFEPSESPVLCIMK